MTRSNGLVVVISDTISSMIKLLNENEVPIIRMGSILEIVKLQISSINAIIIDKPDQNFDTREHLMNADVQISRIPIYIPDYYHKHEDWSIIKSPHRFYIFDTSEALLELIR